MRIVGLVAAATILFFSERGLAAATHSLGLDASQDLAPTLAQISSAPVFDSGEHGNPAVSRLGVLSRGMFLNDERIVLLDGRDFLFINPRTGELWTAGGHGEGPGEFEGTGFELAMFRGEGELTVWDLNNDFRLTSLSDTGELLGTRRVNISPLDFDHPVSMGRLYGLFSDGRLVFADGMPHMAGSNDEGRLPDYLVEVGEGGQRRTIVEFQGAETSTVLFRHVTLVSIGGDRVAVADTESDEIRVVDRNGTTVAALPMPGERARVSDRHLAILKAEARARDRRSHETSLEWLTALGRSTEGLEFKERDYRYNDIAPPIDRMLFGGDGRLWIRHHVMPGDNAARWTVWDDRSGTFLVETPPNEQVLDAWGTLVLLRVRSELGIDRAVIRELFLH